ncbi:MAG: CoA transferase [Polynucleobacter sp.]|jgi:crotonobetainyl-CoA:carnitine CoA-transferase CaiB-like acyl-CoA transferase|nr:CoA transferase [Polynucleobacter sp.]
MSTDQTQVTSLPYAGIRVIEFTHMVMGPTCGMVLGDLGAEVIKIEPMDGDKTRGLLGSGAGFFSMFNRNKKSIAVNINTPAGRKIVQELIATADILCENFKPGTMKKLQLDYDSLKVQFPRLIYVSHKGFLPGPYDHRTALDEVVQMMGGLAYMTGTEEKPLRAGASVNDMMGGIFGAMGAMAALRQRDLTGQGQEIQSALFENNVLLVGQHMMQYAVTGKPAKPMPSRISAWGIYDVFEVAQAEKIFLAVVSDTQWKIFCDIFNWPDLFQNTSYATNNQRVQSRATLIPLIKARLQSYSAQRISQLFADHGLPYAAITRPEQLFDDPHLNATGGLAKIIISDGLKAGQEVTTPLLPITMDGKRLPIRFNPPKTGEHSNTILAELGYSFEEIQELLAKQTIRVEKQGDKNEM